MHSICKLYMTSARDEIKDLALTLSEMSGEDSVLIDIEGAEEALDMTEHGAKELLGIINRASKEGAQYILLY